MHRKFSSNRTSRSSLFLTELIIAIFFLALTSVVCVRLYLYAHQLSARSSALTHSVQETQELAEEFIAANGNLGEMNEAGKLYYDTNWQRTDSPAGAAWRIELTPSDKSEKLKQLHLAVYNAGETDSQEPIYETDVEQYIGTAR